MAKLTLADLKTLRDEQKKKMNAREAEGTETQIIIGMGTCGIAAGAKDAFDAFLDEIEKQEMTGVTVSQTGCMGLCYAEPTVEVRVPGMPPIIYGRVDRATARKIVTEHLAKKALVSDHIFDKPAVDILGN